MNTEQVILVDEKDKPVGVAEKMEAHRKGLLHRAFSVFIFNSRGEMLLQQRAMNKYHSGGLWTNACCSHPKPGEEIKAAAERRLKEELGFDTSLEKIFDFVYKTDFENGLTEFEFDHVFTGEHDGEIIPDREEASDYCYKEVTEISQSLKTHPQKYTTWFHHAFPGIEQWWQNRYNAEVA